MCVCAYFLSNAIVYIAKTDDDDDAPPAHLTVDLFLFFSGGPRSLLEFFARQASGVGGGLWGVG